MRFYLLISLSSHPKTKTLVICWVSLNALPRIEGLVSPELGNSKGVVFRISLVRIEGVICILLRCLTLVSLRIILRKKLLWNISSLSLSLGLGR